MADIEFAKLPSVADLDIETRQRIIALLERLDKVIQEKNKLLEDEDNLKNDLARLQRLTGKSGFRHERLCFVSQSIAGRKTLDKTLLLEHGVAATVLAQCYKQGDSSTRVTFKKLSNE